MNKSRETVVRSIDVGYGNTKFSTTNYSAGCGLELFPSLAPSTTKRQSVDKTGSMLSVGNVIEIQVEGARYAVGKDVINAASTSNIRTLESNYPLTAVYEALVKGALYHMVEKLPDETIDLLVLGLPLNTYDTFRSPLRKKMVGKHYIPNPRRTADANAPSEIAINVADVIVIPQPIGAFLAYSVPRGLNNALAKQINLVLDIGRGTLDWFVSRGNRPLAPRCGAYYGGVAKIASAVADAEDPTIRDNLSLMESIEECLHTNVPVFIRSKPVDLVNKHRGEIEKAIKESVSAMSGKIGDLRDITNVLVTGGGANLFLPEIQKVFPDYDLIVDKNPVFSNVTGFQLAGEEWISKQQTAA